MKRNLLIILTTSIVLSRAFMPDAMAVSLQDAMVSAYQTNPALMAQREGLKSTDELSSQALSGWFPSATFINEEGRETISAQGTPDNTDTNYSRRLILSQPVFNGGETVGQIRRAKHLIKSGRATLERVEQTTLLDAVTAYMNLYQAQEVLKYSQTNVEVLRKHLEFAENRFALGEVTRTDVAQSNSRLSRGIADATRARGDVDSARAAFKRVTGIDADTATYPLDKLDTPENIDQAVIIALNNNPQIHTAQFDALAAKDAVNISKAALLPDVSLRAEMQKTNGFHNLGGRNYDSQSAVVNVTVPIFQSGIEYSRIRANKDTASQRRLDAQSAADSIRESTIRSWQNTEVARSNIKSTSDAIDAAAIALEGVTREAEYGTRTTLDVLDAEQELFTSRVSYARAQRDEIVYLYTLKSNMGQLTAQQLKLPVPLYDPEDHYEKVKFKPVGF